MNHVFDLCSNLASEIKDANTRLINDSNGLNATQAVELTTDFVRSEFKEVKNTYHRNKLYSSDELYVASEERAIGTRWEVVKNHSGQAVPQLVQCTLQYVPILDTLFKRDEFKSIYFGEEGRHSCVDGVYEDFCCGQLYKKTNLYRSSENCLQIQIGHDDFDICNPLQSKAGIHKVCGVYFVIRNMPKKYLSKLKNIYLICLCTANDLKSEQTDFNNLWTMIVNEIHILETVGIDIGGNRVLKGTLACVAYDNLGGNVSFGFAEGFNAFCYCRVCESSNAECKKMVKENAQSIRSRKSYEKQLKIIESSVEVKYDQTKGVKRYCTLNELEYFHVVGNIPVDPMHDLNEGVIPHLMAAFFNHCFKWKIFSLKKLKKMIFSYDFGYLSSRDKPSSNFSLLKRTLGQNAAQSKCLFVHIPYILHDYRDEPKLTIAWGSIQAVLRICLL